MEISKEFPNVPLLSISASTDTVLTDYYLDNINFKGISLFDSQLLFQKRNEKLLSTQNLFLINKEGNVVVSSMDVNDNIIKKIRSYI